MKTKYLFIIVIGLCVLCSCSSSAEFSEKFKSETAGKYLFNDDDVMTISYSNNQIFLDWRGVKTKPVITGDNEFFIPDLYKKMHFVTHPKTGDNYLSVLSEKKPSDIRYDYIKVSNDYKTPSQYIEEKEFDKALVGLLKIKAKDSLSDYINQYKFNRIGYKYSRDKNYVDAIAIFKMNAKLHPNSPNVYDSLAQAYLVSGDSLNAYENYKKTLKLNINNKRAQRFVNVYEDK